MIDFCCYCEREVPHSHFRQGICIIKLKKEIKAYYEKWRLKFMKKELFDWFEEFEKEDSV